MKQTTIYILFLLMMSLLACDPVENRDSIGGEISADELDVSATPIVVDGMNSNKVILRNDSPVLASWNYGLGTTQSSYDTVLMVVTGTATISFTGLNPDGTEITKDLEVTVDTLAYEVPEQWSYLCGTGEKKWVWDDTYVSSGYVWGNGGYRGSVAPSWWGRTLSDITEEDGYAGYDANAYMVFSTDGATLTKASSDGSTVESGTFSFDMSDTIWYNSGVDVWASGTLSTNNVTILLGISQNDDKVDVYDYDIIKLNDDHLVLSYRTQSSGTTDEWGGEAWFWVFKPADE